MIHNKQYNFVLNKAKELNLKYKLPLDFCFYPTNPIQIKYSYWLGALRSSKYNKDKFEKYIKELSDYSKNITSNLYDVYIDNGLNIWYGI